MSEWPQRWYSTLVNIDPISWRAMHGAKSNVRQRRMGTGVRVEVVTVGSEQAEQPGWCTYDGNVLST